MIKKIKILSLIFIMTISTIIAPIKNVSAYNDFYVNNDILFYNPTDTDCGVITNINLSTPGGSYAIWNSNATPDEYSIERFAIETLRYIASKKGVDESTTVTKEHVIALVSFMMGEGGDISNQWLFNPLNSGLNNPEFVAGTHQDNGTQSFKSFNAGITATAITMLGSNQSRLAGILIKENSTAEDFMKVLTYYLDYPGNKAWAEASVGDKADAYYQGRLKIISGVRNAYNHTAGIKMGTPEFEKDKGIYVNSKTLKYGSESDQVSATPTTQSNTNCGGTSLVSGGMTLDQAKAFMNEYKNLTPKIWTRGTEGTPYLINAASCVDASPLANCVAFSQYFINRYTSKHALAVNGGAFVKGLLEIGFQSGGTIPKVYSVFSKATSGGTQCSGGPCGHTGVVLGINQDTNKIIIGEASCSNSLEWADAHEYNLDNYTNSVFTYAYTDKFIKSGAGL